jgi:hypothetical protein
MEEKAGLPYHSPHKFRHGHAVYALKAVNQNLMHDNLSITDGVYGVLSGMEVKGEIANLGKGLMANSNQKELIEILRQIINQYDSK